MAHMWKVGDKAVCIRKNPATLTSGRVYTVVAVTPYRMWDRGSMDVGLVLSEIKNKANPAIGDYIAIHFRPIVKADDDFIAQMRALKPKVKQ